jgi:hypothetical protein
MLRLLQNLAGHRQESRLDKSLRDFADRIRNRRRTDTTTAATTQARADAAAASDTHA